ncbi:MAG: hypothetical protein ACYTGJ_12255 [Planctomycetota bacterium]|jgi:hypothetical protein
MHRAPFLLLLVFLLVGADDPPLVPAKIEFDGKDGKEVFRIDPEGPEAELQSGAGRKTLATYARAGDAITIELPKKDALSRVTADRKGAKYLLSGPDGKTRWRLEREPDGDWELLDADGKEHAKLKLRDDGFKVVDAEDTERGRVKKKEDKLSLRNAAGEEILRTRDTRDELAAACFLLPGLTFPEKGGFALALIVLPPAPRE